MDHTSQNSAYRGDGTVGILDLLALLAAWGSDPAWPRRYNPPKVGKDRASNFVGDGTVAILDLLALLANCGALHSWSESSAVEPSEGQMGNVGLRNRLRTLGSCRVRVLRTRLQRVLASAKSSFNFHGAPCHS